MNTVVLGLQWGDEGKGKAIDYLAGSFSVVVRFQGGHNAGHTVYFQGKKVILHVLPSGIFYPDCAAVIAHGVVVQPLQLVDEINNARALGLSLQNLALSEHAPLILPFHQELDVVFEDSRYQRIGTTRRGIGPAYEDVVGRRALFVGDLLHEDVFRAKIAPLVEYYQRLFLAHGHPGVNLNEGIEQYLQAGDFLRTFVCNTAQLLQQAFSDGKDILFEGAQGSLLDINLGTYPFVTSSNTTIAGVFSGTGLSTKAVKRVIGVSKAYTTRVGEGPFPSELVGENGRLLREWGHEYGSTTGRPRRVGWLDLVALKYAVQINGVDSLFVTKLDVLDELEEIPVAVAYKGHGGPAEMFPPHADVLARVKPVFRSLPGWREKIGAIECFSDLPVQLRDYLRFIEDFVGVRVSYLSLGGERRQTIEISA
ncbi:adenylosuccinate synthase [candidate division KSB1 bacterium]|nr:adenylosuccinate synthase [Candidatus Aminicenantes bacterium]RQW03572.1 MAG: adenylosuccinate synthase [candidate division KSB1 bacterium]